MTMNISTAGAVALPLPGAPIAASRVSDDGARQRRADASTADNRNTDSRSNGVNVNAPGKTPVQLRNANTGNGGNSSTAASREQAGATGTRAGSGATAAAAQQSATGATNPLFAQLLGQAVEDDADTSAEADSSTSTGQVADIAAAAVAAPALPAMAAAVLTAPVVTAVPVPVEAGGDSAARHDSTEAVSAVSTLSVAPTRLNLAAAGVAVHAVTDNAASVQRSNHVGSQLTALATPADSETNKQAQAAATVATAAVAVAAAINPAPAHAVLAQQAGVANSKAGTVQVQATPTATPATEAAVAPAPLVPAAPVSERIATRPLPDSTAGADAARTAAATPASSATATGSKEDSRANASLNGSATVAQPALSAAPVAATSNAGAAVKLAGTPEQWQQPLREALGDRLQLNLQRNNDHAVIRLEPPNMGSIEISIRHSAGALQVNLSANNSEVLRQLNTIGDSVRQDLSSRQFSEVAVTVSSARAQAQSQGQAQADGGRQQREQDQQRTPGRALSEDDTLSTFAMNDQE